MSQGENDNFTYKSQDVSYLGFLEAQLRDLQGSHTLAYELIQNADDVPDVNGRFPTTQLTFDITDEALLVSNNGAFRDEDFARLQSIASGGKREEAGTTGAFGLGFIAVYQVTDAPEIFSNGRHWRITPQAPTAQRIQERPAETTGTLFRLPWAFDPASIVRRTLRLEAIQLAQLDELAQRLAQAITEAALFLKHLQRLEVRRNGALWRRIERQVEGEQLFLRDEKGQTAVHLLLTTDFAATASQLRHQYPWQIEETRHSQVQIALPLTTTPNQTGRLYATLPTDSSIPLPCHINADFFPTTDRKRIHFEGGYQAEWNQAAIVCAGQILAEHFASLPQKLGHRGLWHLLQKTADTHHAAQQNELPAIFTTFWQAITPLFSHCPIVYTAAGQWQVARAVRLAGRSATASLLQKLNIITPHPELLPYLPLLRRPEIAVPSLSINDIATALGQLALRPGINLATAPAAWRELGAWQDLWQLLDSLLAYLPPRERESALQLLRPFPLALSQNMELVRLADCYHGGAEARAIFPHLPWAHPMIDLDAFPGRYLPHFGVGAAAAWLRERPLEQLEQDWRLGSFDLLGLWQWLERQQLDIADEPSLAQAIRQLPLCPVDGELRPLAHLYLPGNFSDPLRLAGLVDVAELGCSRQFLRDLGVAELDFDTYLRVQLPLVWQQQGSLPSDGLHRLVQLLAARLGEIRDDEALQGQLSQLPLVACLDGSFWPANAVYATREVMALLGDGVHVAEPVEGQAVAALYGWLGVRERPSAEDILQALLALDPKVPQPLAAAMWQRLQELVEAGELAVVELARLAERPTIPNRQGRLRRADEIFWADRPDLEDYFAGLADYLLPEGEWVGLTAVLGVRPLSQAVQVLLLAGETAVPEGAAQAHLLSRRQLIERLLRAEGLPLPADFWQKLRVVSMERPQIQYQLLAGKARLLSAPEGVTVKLMGEVLLLAAGGWGWTAVSRELALAFKGGEAIGGLALGLKEVLTAVTFADAKQLLDELGVG